MRTYSATPLGLAAFLGLAALARADFVDVTAPPLGDSGGIGVAWGDYDGDGDPDLYLSNNGLNDLFRNDGNNVFADVTAAPLATAGNGGPAWADVDNDGDLDLYVGHRTGVGTVFANAGGGAFTVAARLGQGTYNAAWGDYDRDGLVDLLVANWSTVRPKLYRHLGSMQFVDVTPPAMASGPIANAAAWVDHDGDGDLDIYLSTGDGTNRLLRNDGEGFVNATPPALAVTALCRGQTWGDYDNDGDPDLYLGITGTNRLIRNDGGGSFVDVTMPPLGDGGSGYGVDWGDYDNDGDLDLHLANWGGPNRLFRNDGGTFVDATTPGVSVNDGFGTAWADADGDGDVDLYVAAELGPARLFRNDDASGNHWIHVKLRGLVSNASGVGARVRVESGGLVQLRDISAGAGYMSQGPMCAAFGLGSRNFVDRIVVEWPSGAVQEVFDPPVDTVLTIVEQGPVPCPHVRSISWPGLADPTSSVGVAWVDLDGDGDPDLHVPSRAGAPDRVHRNDGAAGFVLVDVPGLAWTTAAAGIDWGDYDNDGDPDLYRASSDGANRLLRNDGGTFTDVTAPPIDGGGVDGSVSWIDYDRDGRLDLYLTTDVGPNRLYRNVGGGFVEATPAALAIALPCAASAWGDYDADGDSDVYVSVVGGPNRLVRNDGGGAFTDVTVAPLDDAGAGRGVAWGDYDSDGDLDLYLVNGGTPNRLFRNDAGQFADVASGALADDGDGRSGVWADFENDGDLDLVVTNAGGPSRFLRNDGGDSFESCLLGNGAAPCRGAAWADYDGDGDLDLFLANDGTLDRLYRNESALGLHWLEVALVGTTSNRSAVGARVAAVSMAHGWTRTREIGSNRGLGSCDALPAHLGLRTATEVDLLYVRWPSGAAELFPAISVDRRITVIEGGGIVDAPLPPAREGVRFVARPNPFRGGTEIRLGRPDRAGGLAEIFDVRGRLVRSFALLSGADVTTLWWDGRDREGRAVPNGVYFLRLPSEGRGITGKIVRIR